MRAFKWYLYYIVTGNYRLWKQEYDVEGFGFDTSEPK
jgi:hypothetical protein